MASGQVDPARLTGDALRRWYLRSPEVIEHEKQAAAAARYVAFFGTGRSGEWSSGSSASEGPSPHTPQLSGAVQRSSGDPHAGLGWSPAGPNRWRRDEAGNSTPFPHPVPLPSPNFGRADQWIRPVPLLPVEFPPGGTRPAPLTRMHPDRLASAQSPSTNASLAQSVAYRPPPASAPKSASQPKPAAHSQRHGIWIAGRQPGELDPSSADVFQTGPDGKLHPVAGWRTTGPFDFADWSKMFDWGGVGDDLADIASGALDFMGGGGLAGEALKGLRYKIGQDVVRGIIHGHHSWPKFMGGPTKQELARLYESLHVDFHAELAAAFKEAGFPRIGGKGGGAKDWAQYFTENAGKADEAMEILRRTTRDFDRRNGTHISKYLDGTLSKNKPSAGPPPR